MRTSNNIYDQNGHLLHGYDYDLQVWVKNGIILDCGHPLTSSYCCNAHLYFGQHTSSFYIKDGGIVTKKIV